MTSGGQTCCSTSCRDCIVSDFGVSFGRNAVNFIISASCSLTGCFCLSLRCAGCSEGCDWCSHVVTKNRNCFLCFDYCFTYGTMTSFCFSCNFARCLNCRIFYCGVTKCRNNLLFTCYGSTYRTFFSIGQTCCCASGCLAINGDNGMSFCLD